MNNETDEISEREILSIARTWKGSWLVSTSALKSAARTLSLSDPSPAFNYTGSSWARTSARSQSWFMSRRICGCIRFSSWLICFFGDYMFHHMFFLIIWFISVLELNKLVLLMVNLMYVHVTFQQYMYVCVCNFFCIICNSYFINVVREKPGLLRYKKFLICSSIK